MFRSDDRRGHAPGKGLILFGATLAVAALIGTRSAALAEEGPAYRSPPSESAPHAVPAVPEAGQRPGAGRGEPPGATDQDGSRNHEFTPGCPYRDRPLNLLV